MKTSDFDYRLPKELIAQKPTLPRDKCRLLVFERKTGKIIHTRFDKIGDFLKPDDVLVLNDTKVIPARMVGRRLDNGNLGRKFEVLLLSQNKADEWQVLVDGKKRRVGLKILFDEKNNLIGELINYKKDGIWIMKFNKKGKILDRLIWQLGEMPTPPYIKQKTKHEAKNWYQTIFAKYVGSVAAPTAGLHFSKKLLAKFKKQKIEIEYITLHVGLGTFQPVRAKNIKEHKMHAEFAIVEKDVAERLNLAKKQGRRIIAVGTTATRTLEDFTDKTLRHKQKWIKLFIYPSYKFKFVDVLLTNFHLPKTTLLMLVAAFLDKKPKPALIQLKKIYQQAIKKKYQFYSYGDAMLIL